MLAGNKKPDGVCQGKQNRKPETSAYVPSVCKKIETVAQYMQAPVCYETLYPLGLIPLYPEAEGSLHRPYQTCPRQVSFNKGRQD